MADNEQPDAQDELVAVVPEEEEEEEKFDPTEYTPALLEILPVTWGPIKKRQDIPEPDQPYYLIAKDGLYLYKRHMLGYSLTKTTKTPPNLSDLGSFSGGCYWWAEEPIPAYTVAQAVSFFREVYKRWKAEAEVLILYNPDAPQERRFKLFVPAQKVSGGSVHSAYDPADVPKGFYVVGSMHSHCAMGAFHSGTDTNDASSFNGIHVTVGHVDRDDPEFAVMGSVDGQNFHFNGKKIDIVLDTSDLKAAKFPEGWLHFLLIDDSSNKSSIKSKVKDSLKGQLNNFRGQTSTPSHRRPTYPGYTGGSGPYSGGSSNYMNYWKRTGPGASKTHLTELRGSFPDEWFATTPPYPKTLLPAKWPDALEELLDDIADIAETHGIELVYQLEIKLNDETKDEIKKVTPDSSPEPTETAEEVDEDIRDVKELLPGPMEVPETAHESESEHRVPIH